MDKQVFDVLQGTLMDEPNTRMRSELSLKQFEQNVQYPLSVATVASASEISLAVRQAAIVQLRGYVNRHWSIAAAKYETGPIPSQEIKGQVREKVFMLLSNTDRRIRTISAAVVAAVARYDWPDEWPQLFDQLLELIRNGNKDQVHSAMCVFNEWVNSDMSEQQLEQLGRLLPELRRIFLSSDKFDVDTRVMAVSVFGDCIEIISNVSFDKPEFADAHVPPILLEWMVPIAELIKQPVLPGASQNGGSIIPLKAECTRTIVKAADGLPKYMLPHNPTILEAVWMQLKQLSDPYSLAFVYDSSDHSQEAVDMLTCSADDSDEPTIDLYLLGIFEWLSKISERKSMRKYFVSKPTDGSPAATPTPFFVELVTTLMAYSQITIEMLEDWDDDMGLFVADEDEEGYRFNVRISAQELVGTLADTFPRELPAILWHSVQERLKLANQWKQQGSNNWWLVSEAILWTIGIASSNIIESQKKQQSTAATDLGQLFESVVLPLAQDHRYPFGQGRAFIFASSFAEVLPQNIATLFSDASSKAISDPSMHPAVRLSAVRATGNLCRHLPIEMMRQHQEIIIKGLGDIIPQLSEDSVHVALDTLHVTLKLDQEITASLEPVISQTILGVWQKYPGDILLTGIVIDIVESMAGNPHVYESFTQRALPVIGAAITQSNDSLVISSAIDLLSGFVKGGPSPMPSGYVDAVFPALMQVLSASTDNEVLQSGQACLKYLVQKDIQQIAQWHNNGSNDSGINLIIQFASRLLSPDTSESSALFIGDLISKLVQKGSRYIAGNDLAQLIQVVTTRLSSARTSSFSMSLIPLYSQLVVHHTSEVIDLLDSMNFESQTGLQVVLSSWFKNYLEIQGYYNRKVSAAALMRLYTLNDSRIDNFIVQGDIIPNAANAGKIVTRSMSRANPDKYTQIPASAKIIKLLLAEMSIDVEALYARSNGSGLYNTINESSASADEVGDEWEDDEFDNDYDPLSELAPADQYGFLSDMVDDGAGYEDDDDDDEDIQADPIYKQDLNESLGMFLREAVDSNNQARFNSVVGPTLNEKEADILRNFSPN